MLACAPDHATHNVSARDKAFTARLECSRTSTLRDASGRMPIRRAATFGTITVAHDRPSAAIAREIERILPNARESLSRLNARKRDEVALHARRQHAFEAILRLVPSTDRCPAYSGEAPRPFLGPTVSLDLRIDDIDSVTTTQWYGLDLNTVLRLIETVLGGGPP